VLQAAASSAIAMNANAPTAAKRTIRNTGSRYRRLHGGPGGVTRLAGRKIVALRV
jgi:hypothetical protein